MGYIPTLVIERVCRREHHDCRFCEHDQRDRDWLIALGVLHVKLTPAINNVISVHLPGVATYKATATVSIGARM